MTDSNSIIARDEVKGIIKAFDTETRAAIDKALALGNDFVRAHADEASKVAKARAVAIFHIAKDKEAVEKTGYDSFKELSAALFGMEPSTATNYRKAAERFYCNADAPQKLGEWYGPSALYELVRSKASNEELAAAIERGELKEGMTSRELRAWSESRKALTEGEKPEVARLYDGSVLAIGGFDTDRPRMYTAEFHGATEDEIRAALALSLGKCIFGKDAPEADDYAVGVEDDRIGRFNPHAELDNGKKKVTGKGMFAASCDAMAKAVYFPHTTKAKEKEDNSAADTIKAQNATIAELMAKIAALEAAQNK